MDFFHAQDVARKNTARLVLYFTLAIISLVILTNLLVMIVFGYIDSEVLTLETIIQQFDWQVFWMISIVVVIVILLGSLYKIMVLSTGGAGIAEMMGGQLIVDGSGDINKQKVLNVVEEIAIASGTPVPPVYLLDDEEGINAFAAGYKPSDAIVAVTRGTIEKLNRDQLQGVIAHEFSHILNGDMRLNVRLIGILHGILIIGVIGYFLLRSAAYSGGARRSSRDSSGAAFLALGMGLMVIGYAGTFFGNLIKAAVSRQREYLADASAVQFTRNPTGIAGALKKIGADSLGSLIGNPRGSEVSHAYFSQGVKTFFSTIMATHPPLENRIRRIQPSWDGNYDFGQDSTITSQTKKAKKEKPPPKGHTLAAAITAASLDAISHIGQPTQAHLEYAQRLTKELSPTIKQAVHEPHGARAVIYFLVLDKDLILREKQFQFLKSNADKGVYEVVFKLASEIPDFNIKYRLPVVDLAMATLRQLSKRQYQLFKDNLNALVEIDDKIDLFEWVLQKIVFHYLDEVFIKPRPVVGKYRSFQQVKNACRVLFSLIIYSSHQQGISEQAVFDLAKEKLGLTNITLLEKSKISLSLLNNALGDLNQLKILMKPQLLKACVTCITADKTISLVEAELLRVISDVLDCPMPPLLLETAD